MTSDRRSHSRYPILHSWRSLTAGPFSRVLPLPDRCPIVILTYTGNQSCSTRTPGYLEKNMMNLWSPPRRCSSRIILILLFISVPSATAFQNRGGHVTPGGGAASGGEYRIFGAAGLPTAVPSFSGEYAQFDGTIFGFARPSLVIQALPVDFGSHLIGVSTIKTDTVWNFGGSSLLIWNLRFQSGRVDTVFRIVTPAGDSTIVLPGGHEPLAVKFTPQTGGIVIDTILADSNDPWNPVWKLALIGTGTSSPMAALGLSADSIDFGSVPLDSSETTSFTIISQGGIDLSVDSIVTTGGGVFSATPNFFPAIAPGSDTTISVSFVPAAASSYRESLRIFSNVAGSPTEIPLIGKVASSLATTALPGPSFHFTAEENGSSPGAQHLLVRNEGWEPLHWSANPVSAAWLSVETDSGVVEGGESDTVTVSVNIEGLATGAYSDSLVVRNTLRPIETETIPITLIIEAFALTVVSVTTVEESDPLSVAVYSNADLGGASLYYRRGGESVFQTIAMSSTSDTSFSVILPTSAVGARGVELYVEATSGPNSVRKPNYPVRLPRRIVVVVEDEPTTTLPAGEYRMISVPLNTSAAGPTQLLVDDLPEHSKTLWRLLRWTTAGEAYAEHPGSLGAPVDAGYAFWLVARDAVTIDASGSSTFPADAETTFSIPVTGKAGSSGWNQIGNPFAYPVRWSDCFVKDGSGIVRTIGEAANAGLVDGWAHAYQNDGSGGSYVSATLLEPGSGYFLNNLSGVSLELLVPARESTVGKVPSKRAEPEADDGSWTIRLTASLGALSGDVVTLGTREDAEPDWDAHDHYLPPSPPTGAPRLALHNERAPVPGPLMVDMRKSSNNVEVWRLSLSFPGEKETSLFTDLPTGFPEGYEAYLVDDVAGSSRPIDRAEPVRITPRAGERERDLRLVAGPREALGRAGYAALAEPGFFALRTANPNPFRGGTTIHYRIPERGRVRLQIFNISGRLVSSLVDQSTDSGEHISRWAGTDDRGRRVASGIYFVRLEFGNQYLTTRLAKLR